MEAKQAVVQSLAPENQGRRATAVNLVGDRLNGVGAGVRAAPHANRYLLSFFWRPKRDRPSISAAFVWLLPERPSASRRSDRSRRSTRGLRSRLSKSVGGTASASAAAAIAGERSATVMRSPDSACARVISLSSSRTFPGQR